MTVPGIGPIISSAIVAAIGTGDAFSKDRDLGAWLGLVPKQISTGDRTILGGMSKRGNRFLRALFVQAAWVVLVKVGRKHSERYGLKSWIEAAKKRLHHNVLAIALANKLARIAWSVLLMGEPLRPTRFRPHNSTRMLKRLACRVCDRIRNEMEDRSSRRMRNLVTLMARGSLSAIEIARALISMMARSTNGSNQKPDTLMQDRASPQLGEVFLQRTAGPYIRVICVQIETFPALAVCPLSPTSGQKADVLGSSVRQ